MVSSKDYSQMTISTAKRFWMTKGVFNSLRKENQVICFKDPLSLSFIKNSRTKGRMSNEEHIQTRTCHSIWSVESKITETEMENEINSRISWELSHSFVCQALTQKEQQLDLIWSNVVSADKKKQSHEYSVHTLLASGGEIEDKNKSMNGISGSRDVKETRFLSRQSLE